MPHIAYKGLPPLASDLLGGQIPAAIDALPDLIALHRAGKIRILATSGASRSPLSPRVPTFAEQGFASIEAASWVAMYAPAKTPDPVIGRLSKAISTSLQAPELRERLVKLGYDPTGTTPAELAAIMAADTERWAPIIKASGFRAD
jgi:tripartite-type tricarboxylate transporter receptor subunit TctC